MYIQEWMMGSHNSVVSFKLVVVNNNIFAGADFFNLVNHVTEVFGDSIRTS